LRLFHVLRARLASAILMLCLAIAAPAGAETWLRTETPRFILYSNGGEQTLRDYAERLELLDATFWEVYGLPRPPPPSRKLPIYLVNDISGLREVAPKLLGTAVGFYSADAGETFAMALARRGNDYVLLHEYVHHLTFQNFPFGYPAWFVEGYAEYFMTTTVDESDIKVGLASGRAEQLPIETWLPMQDVLSKRVGEVPYAQRDIFYAQSWLLTHYLVSDPKRAQQLQAYLTALGRGENSVAAMEAATGVKTDTWQRRLLAYLKGQTPYVQFKKSQFPETKVEVTRLSPGVSALLLDDLHVRSGVAEEYKAPLLADIRRKVAQYPDEPFAQLAQARAEILMGDPSVAAAILRKQLTANPRNVDALAAQADLLMALGDKTPAKKADYYNQAGSVLVAAFKLDPGRYQTLLAFARSRVVEPDYPSDNTLTALLTTVKLAPQVGIARLDAAEALVARGRDRDAVVVLTPLANSPHESGEAKRAREMLARIGTPKQAPKP
jgi:tetratricopeptide (TPR) repeat protein